MVSVDVKHHAYLLGIKHQVTYFRSLFSCSHFSFSATFPFFPLAQIHSHSSTCSVTQFIPVVYSPSSSLWFILPVHPCGLSYHFIPLVYSHSSSLWFILPVHPSGLSSHFFQPVTDQFQFIHPCFCLPPIDLKVVVGLCMLTTITIYFIHPSWKYLVLDHISSSLLLLPLLIFFFINLKLKGLNSEILNKKSHTLTALTQIHTLSIAFQHLPPKTAH